MVELYNIKHNAYHWVKKVIDSCTTYFHFQNAHKLVDNFQNMYGDSDLSSKLRWYLSNREILKK
jgi:hypothetical protein